MNRLEDIDGDINRDVLFTKEIDTFIFKFLLIKNKYVEHNRLQIEVTDIRQFKIVRCYAIHINPRNNFFWVIESLLQYNPKDKKEYLCSRMVDDSKFAIDEMMKNDMPDI